MFMQEKVNSKRQQVISFGAKVEGNEVGKKQAGAKQVEQFFVQRWVSSGAVDHGLLCAKWLQRLGRKLD